MGKHDQNNANDRSHTDATSRAQRQAQQKLIDDKAAQEAATRAEIERIRLLGQH